MIGGQGEKKTLRMMAQYAEMANFTATFDEAPRKARRAGGTLCRHGSRSIDDQQDVPRHGPPGPLDGGGGRPAQRLPPRPRPRLRRPRRGHAGPRGRPADRGRRRRGRRAGPRRSSTWGSTASAATCPPTATSPRPWPPPSPPWSRRSAEPLARRFGRAGDSRLSSSSRARGCPHPRAAPELTSGKARPSGTPRHNPNHAPPGPPSGAFARTGA